MDLGQHRELHKGFGDALSRAFELAVTPAIFGFLGWLLDAKIGTRPLFMLLFGGFTLCYLTWKQFRQYDEDMRREEAKLLGQPADRVPVSMSKATTKSKSKATPARPLGAEQ